MSWESLLSDLHIFHRERPARVFIVYQFSRLSGKENNRDELHSDGVNVEGIAVLHFFFLFLIVGLL